MKINLPRISIRKFAQPQEKLPAEFVDILEVKENENKVYLRLAMSGEFYNELYEFLEQKGYIAFGREKEVMSMLLEFGLSEESREELERNEEEMWNINSSYAAMSFETSEYYSRNFEITKGLRLHLRRNKSLKQELQRKGLKNCVCEDEWDKWDESFISELYRRYVFHK